jgi:hypothetical protein
MQSRKGYRRTVENRPQLLTGKRIPMEDLSREFLTESSESLDTVDGGFLTNDR